MRTVYEMSEYLATQLEPIEILELLEIEADELLWSFDDHVEAKLDELNEEFFDDED